MSLHTLPDPRTDTAPLVPAPTRGRRRWRRPAVAVLALLFFFGPAGAFLLGARPHEIENRKLSAFPSLSDGWKFLPELTTWATDHLPLRGEAVRADASVSEHVFGEAPSYGSSGSGSGVAGLPAAGGGSAAGSGTQYPKVVQGTDDWLYFGDDVSNLCQPTDTVAATLSRLDRLAAAVEASGRRFVLAIAPDKTDVSPQQLPSSYVGQGCSTARRTAFWKAVASTPPEGYLDLRSAVLAEQQRTGQSIYRATDTHWGPRGGALYAQALADRLDPSLAQGTQVVETGQVSEPGDLGPMIGQPRTDRAQGVEVQRTGVQPVERGSLALPQVPYAPQTFRATSTGAPLFQPRTLILGDSFTSASGSALGTYFADVTLLHNQTAGPYPEAVAGVMADADVVVYEIVERDIASGRSPLTSDRSLAAIEKTLAAHHR